jgi:UDP-glucose 4-epimerase
MRIAVTGSQSFIGTELIAQAAAAGIEVVGIDRVPGAPGDLVMDVRDPKLADALPAGIDALVHLAAISRDSDCRNDPYEAFDVNVMGTLNVIRACVARGIGQLVFASSEWVYGEVDRDGVQREDQAIDVTRFDGEYALSKIVGERLIAMARRQGLENATVLRFGIVYGPRPSNWSAVEALFDQAGSKDAISVGSLGTARRFIHVGDIASGILAALGRTGFEIFNLSGDRLITLGDVIAASVELHGTHPTVTEKDPTATSVRNPDNAKAVAQLNWRPKYDLAAGLATLRAPLEAAR